MTFFVSTWETFAKKRYEQGFLQGYAETHGGLEALDRHYAERSGQDIKTTRAAKVRKDTEVTARHVAGAERESAERDLLTKTVDLLIQEISERKRLAKRVAELERLTNEREQ